MRLFGISGWSGSGKTTLVTRLLPELSRRGLTVSTIKHAHHNFEIDHPGKDSYEHRKSGACEVLVSSVNRWAIVHENRDGPEPSLESLVARLAPVDLVLVEGFKREAYDRLEVHRPSVGKELLCGDDPHIVAVASDAALTDVSLPRGLPVLDLDDVPGIAGFIVTHCRLDGARATVG